MSWPPEQFVEGEPSVLLEGFGDHAERQRQNPSYYWNRMDDSWGDGSPGVIEFKDWMATVPVELRAEKYLTLAFGAKQRTDEGYWVAEAYSPVEWAILNLARHDHEAQGHADRILNEAGIDQKWQDLYEGDAIDQIRQHIVYQGFENRRRDRFRGLGFLGQRDNWVDSDSTDGDPFGGLRARFELGMQMGQQEGLWSDNRAVQVGADFMQTTIGIGGALTVGGLFVKAGWGAVAKTQGGKWIGQMILRQYRDPNKAVKALRWIMRNGALAGSTTAGVLAAGLTVQDVIDSFDDEGQNQQVADEQRMIAEMAKIGLYPQQSGQAGGENLILAQESTVWVDENGIAVTDEDAQERLNTARTEGSVAGEVYNQDTEAAVRMAEYQASHGNYVLAERTLREAGLHEEADALDATVPVTSAGNPVVTDGVPGEIDIEEALDEFYANAENLGKVEDPYLGGLSEDYRRPSMSVDDQRRMQPYNTGYISNELTGTPRYRKSSIEDQIADWTFADVIEFQERAIAAKLIDPDRLQGGLEFKPGTIDYHTTTALENAMTFANIEGGVKWDTMLDTMIDAAKEFEDKYGSGDAADIWTPSSAYFAPDYASISQTVKDTFGRELGRTPNDWEMDLLADNFRGDHRAAYDSAMQGEKSAFDANARAQEIGEIQYPDDQQAIDPVSRMGETFDKQFEPELNAKDRWADAQSKSRNLFGSFSKLGR